MGHYTTIELPNGKLKLIKSLGHLRELLTREEKDFLDHWYPDLFIDEDGYICLDDHYRKNYESEKWISILKKIAIKEQDEFQILFIDDDVENSWGFKARENGVVHALSLSWTEAKTGDEDEIEDTVEGS